MNKIIEAKFNMDPNFDETFQVLKNLSQNMDYLIEKQIPLPSECVKNLVDLRQRLIEMGVA